MLPKNNLFYEHILNSKYSETSQRTSTNLSQNEPQREKTCLRRFANNTGADQPAHSRSLISAYVIRVLESTISKLATSEISAF